MRAGLHLSKPVALATGGTPANDDHIPRVIQGQFAGGKMVAFVHSCFGGGKGDAASGIVCMM